MCCCPMVDNGDVNDACDDDDVVDSGVSGDSGDGADLLLRIDFFILDNRVSDD